MQPPSARACAWKRVFSSDLGQLLDRGLREDGPLIAQQIVRVHFVVEHQFHALQVARAQQQRLRKRLAVFDQQRRARHVQLVERAAIELGLGFLDLQRIHHRQLAVGQLRSQRRAQRAQQLLARESIVVAARLRSVHRAAVAPQGRTHRADTRAARALLLPQLLAGTGNQLAVLGGCACPGAARRDSASPPPTAEPRSPVRPNTASASSSEPTFSPFRFTTSTFAIVFFFRRHCIRL